MWPPPARWCFRRGVAHPDPTHGYRDKISGIFTFPSSRPCFSMACSLVTRSRLSLRWCADLAAVQHRCLAGWRDQGVQLVSRSIPGVVVGAHRPAGFGASIVGMTSCRRRTGCGIQASLRSVLWWFMQNGRFRLTLLPLRPTSVPPSPGLQVELPVHVLHGGSADDTNLDPLPQQQY